MCKCARVCVWPCWITVPNVEEFERIEQHPFLHVVINLLIGPKARSPIDLPEKWGETHSKNICFVVFFYFVPPPPPSQFSRQKCFVITGVDLGHLWKKRNMFLQKGEKRGKQRGDRNGKRSFLFFFFSQGHFGTFSLCLDINSVHHLYACPWKRKNLCVYQCPYMYITCRLNCHQIRDHFLLTTAYGHASVI